MKITFRNFVALLLATFFLPACSMLTSSGRQQAAYARYVRKSSKGRVKQQKMFHSNKPPMPMTMPEQESTETVRAEDSGPQAVAQNAPLN